MYYIITRHDTIQSRELQGQHDIVLYNILTKNPILLLSMRKTQSSENQQAVYKTNHDNHLHFLISRCNQIWHSSTTASCIDYMFNGFLFIIFTLNPTLRQMKGATETQDVKQLQRAFSRAHEGCQSIQRSGIDDRARAGNSNLKKMTQFLISETRNTNQYMLNQNHNSIYIKKHSNNTKTSSLLSILIYSL